MPFVVAVTLPLGLLDVAPAPMRIGPLAELAMTLVPPKTLTGTGEGTAAIAVTESPRVPPSATGSAPRALAATVTVAPVAVTNAFGSPDAAAASFCAIEDDVSPTAVKTVYVTPAIVSVNAGEPPIPGATTVRIEPATTTFLGVVSLPPGDAVSVTVTGP